MTFSARRVGRHLTTSRIAHSHTSSLSQQPQNLVGADVASKRGFASKKKKGKSEEEAVESYFDRKAASKQLRVEAYKHKLERAVRIQSRRDNSPKDVKKDEFRSWWSGRMAYEEKMDRKARQAGMDWTIQVATIVERLPIVMPDKEGFETEFEDLQAYLHAHRGKEYPKEFVGSGGRPEAYTDEELMGTLYGIQENDSLCGAARFECTWRGCHGEVLCFFFLFAGNSISFSVMALFGLLMN